MLDLKTRNKKNPITASREKLGLTRINLAALLSVNVSALLLLERGCYTTILPKVLKYFVDEGYDAKDLEENYRAYQLASRRIAGELFELTDFELGEPILTEHPFISFRRSLGINGLSQQGFAKWFCVPPSSLHELERGIRVHLPEGVQVALLEAGLSGDVLSELSFRIKEVRDYYRVA